jgi:hypothetical protein
MLIQKGNYTFGAYHPSDNTVTINQGRFSIIGMRFTKGTLQFNGFPGTYQSIEETNILNIGDLSLSGLYYQVIGLDSIVNQVIVEHPTYLAPGMNTMR